MMSRIGRGTILNSFRVRLTPLALRLRSGSAAICGLILEGIGPDSD